MHIPKSFRAFALLTIFATIGFVSYHVYHDEQRKIHALGLDHVSLEIARRHIAIVEGMPTTLIRDDISPVHIMFRKTSKEAWVLLGSGTHLIRARGHAIITAHHVLGGHSGEFGYREINRKIFTGETLVLPIVKVTDPHLMYDLIFCYVGFGKDFLNISVYKRTFESTRYRINETSGTLQLLTHPQKPLHVLSFGDSTQECRYVQFEGDVTYGESGTGGIINKSENSLLVVTREISYTLGSKSFKGGEGVEVILKH